MTTVTITLQEEDQKFIAIEMREGRYESESEAVAAAIAELRAKEDLRKARLGELRAQISVGLAELDRGESGEWDAKEIREKGRQLLATGKMH